MIYVLECPAAGAPRAWFAYDSEDLVERVADRRGLSPWEVWDRRSVRELLAMCGEQPDAAGVAERLPALCALGATHGWDTLLFRADALLGEGLLSATAVDPLQACTATLDAGGLQTTIWPDEASAILALEDDTLAPWQGPGWRARHALREQLVATEALADA